MTETLANRRVFRSKVDAIRPTYGFDDVSLAPGTDTVDPADVVLAQDFCGLRLEVPVTAAAMDAVADVRLSGELARLGGLAILNLEGVQFRYDDPAEVLDRIIAAPDGEVQDVLAAAYQAPIREDLIGRRIAELHAVGSKAALSATPGIARRYGPLSAEQGADLFLVQSQVSSARHLATGYEPLALCRVHPLHADPGRGRQHDQRRGRVPADGAGRRGDLRRRRARAPPARRARCWGSASRRSRRSCDVAAARDAYLAETGRYVPVVADGGMKRGGDIAKALAAGRGRRDARLAARACRGGARAGDELGHGRAVAGAAARDPDPGGDRRARSTRSSTAPRTSPTAPRTWWARCASRWRRSAPGRSPTCTTSRSSTRRPS